MTNKKSENVLDVLDSKVLYFGGQILTYALALTFVDLGNVLEYLVSSVISSVNYHVNFMPF